MKNISYKILVILMIMMSLLFFNTPTKSYASRIQVKDGEFYYSGVQDAQYVVEASWKEKLAKALSEIADYAIGLMTLGLRGVVVGFIELFEIILTALLQTEKSFTDVISEALLDFGNPEAYEDTVITIEKIIFNRNSAAILDANMFRSNDDEDTE